MVLSDPISDQQLGAAKSPTSLLLTELHEECNPDQDLAELCDGFELRSRLKACIESRHWRAVQKRDFRKLFHRQMLSTDIHDSCYGLNLSTMTTGHHIKHCSDAGQKMKGEAWLLAWMLDKDGKSSCIFLGGHGCVVPSDIEQVPVDQVDDLFDSAFVLSSSRYRSGSIAVPAAENAET